MDKYAISWISFFDNELCMDVIGAISGQEALEVAYLKLTGTEYVLEEDDEDIKQAAFNCDGMIGAILIG